MHKLDALRRDKVAFMLAALPDGTVAWFLPNLDVSDDPEDWAFHALRCGIAADLEAAADAIAGCLVAT